MALIETSCSNKTHAKTGINDSEKSYKDQTNQQMQLCWPHYLQAATSRTRPHSLSSVRHLSLSWACLSAHSPAMRAESCAVPSSSSYWRLTECDSQSKRFDFLLSSFLILMTFKLHFFLYFMDFILLALIHCQRIFSYTFCLKCLQF